VRKVHPEIFLISRPSLDWTAISRYLESVSETAPEWAGRIVASDLSDGETLVEFGGRMCYRSWVADGSNPNVTRVREDSDAYLRNIVASGHGSVLEHANYSFVFHNVSRVFTHELVRHRAGVAISQESMRYVRLTEIPYWLPDWVDPETAKDIEHLTGLMEDFQVTMADRFDLDNPEVPFSEKKAKTSFMRRMAPDGVATGVLWTANLRTLRHVIEMRTSLGAEEEIRLVFARVGEVMREECPSLFGDFTVTDDGAWVPEHRKI
jgi:thymidylate synthase (FAD)